LTAKLSNQYSKECKTVKQGWILENIKNICKCWLTSLCSEQNCKTLMEYWYCYWNWNKGWKEVGYSDCFPQLKSLKAGSFNLVLPISCSLPLSIVAIKWIIHGETGGHPGGDV
jgi:hypothetical protein